ncbi:sensor histidine kinase [Amycolatopsis sp. NPDC004368]
MPFEGRSMWPGMWRALAAAVVLGGRPRHRVTASRGVMVARFIVTAGVVAWCLFAAVSFPPARWGPTPVLGLAMAAAAAVPVVVSEVSPLWAWRGVIVLAAVSPWVYPDLALQWGWAWTPSLGGAALVVLYRVGVSCRGAVVGWVFALSAVVAVVLPVQALHHAVVMTGGIAAALASGHVVGLWRRAERERAEQQRRRAQQEKRAATLAERNAIARELHDVVAHHMSVLALRCDSARYRFPELSKELCEEFAALHTTARDGLAEMRRLLRVLRSTTDEVEIEPQPTANEITAMVERIRDSGIEVVFRQDGDLEGAPAGVALSVYRILQEALSNAVRHAPGSAVSVEITDAEVGLRLVVCNEITAKVRDDGAGAGHGLVGMRERAVMLGGTLEAGPDATGRFVVTASLPIEKG